MSDQTTGTAAPQTDKQREEQEAALAAQISAEHAQRAAEQAEADDLAARQAGKEKASNRLCPNCRAEMQRHGNENPYKVGCWHCDNCGSCWQPGLKQQREGHMAPMPPTVAATTA